jgi:hypothetical protein
MIPWPLGDSHPGLAEISNAEDKDHALKAAKAFKLLESAQARWRAVNAPHLVAPWSAPGRTFEKGKLIKGPDESGDGIGGGQPVA